MVLRDRGPTDSTSTSHVRNYTDTIRHTFYDIILVSLCGAAGDQNFEAAEVCDYRRFE
jgi:hypothetical protein